MSVEGLSVEGDSREKFLRSLSFAPDRFQLEAFDALDAGENVIVAAPTGAGKTIVASYAVARALEQGDRVFYTTPIKALSNQKFHDLIADHGRDNVGLLTGDNSINGEAPVVVMTTEVLRNMLYAGNKLERLAAVVLDEVHYLQDSYRGPVWEEVIIHLPRHIQLVALSATVSNSAELADWMGTVRGATALVVEQQRPVELENLYFVAERSGHKLHMLRSLVAGKPNQKGFRFDADPRLGRSGKRHGPRAGRSGKRHVRKYRTPNRLEVVAELRQRELLPAIFFIFSRAGCADAAKAVLDSGIVLTSQSERSEITAIADRHVSGLDQDSLKVLDYERFLAALLAGVAPHHAGMVPPLKETVEACFVRGLTKVVFATETLALGINMPAKTVVLDKLTKYTGDGHAALTPAQFTQLTGRAGRRGIDTQGKAVVLWSPFVQFEQVSTLAASKDFVLTSAFRPTYNMAANLVRRYEPERARQLLNLSFAQFRADADVVRAEHGLERLLDRSAQLTNRLEKEFGPVAELRAAVETRKEVAVDQQEIAFALSQLSLGDVIEVSPKAGRLQGQVAVISVAYRKGRRIKVVVVDDSSETYEMRADFLEEPPVVIGRVELPEPYLPHSVSFLHEVSQALRRTRFGQTKRRRLGPTGAIQSVSDVPVTVRKGLKRIDKVEAQIAAMRRLSRSQTESLGLQFELVVDLLEDRGHLSRPQQSRNESGVASELSWQLTDSGQRLARLYHECDLLLVESLEEGLFDGLNPAELAALTSAFSYEDRRSGPEARPWYPTSELRRRFGALTRLHRDLSKVEAANDLPLTRSPDAGFMAMAHGWAAGGGLEDVLSGSEITAGDFVRTAKLLIDLLRQISKLAQDPQTGRAAAQASEKIFRDLVAASSMVEIDDAQPVTMPNQ